MEGTVLFETNSSVHPTSFGHPPLKLANSPSNSFSRTDWSSHRGLWSTDQNNSSAQNDQSHPRSQQATNFHSDIRAGTLSRPAFVPTTKSIRGAEAPALSPIDNPKGPSKPPLDPWSTSVGASTLTAQQANLPSPSKYRNRGWSFEDDLGFPSENSTLLQDSAPDIDIVDDPQLDRYGVTKDSAVGVRGAVNNKFDSDVRNRRILQPARNSASHIDPFTNNNLQTSLINGARSRAPEPTPYPQFDSSSTPGRVRQYLSSTSKETSENSLRFLNNQQNRSSMIDKTADAMAAVTLNTPAVSSRANYSENDPFRMQDRGLDVTSRNNVPSRSMLCVEGADFQPMSMSGLYDINVPDNLYGGSNFSSLWYSERSTPSLSNDFFVNGTGRVHSTTMTPPTAQYSAQSRGDSGISSRTSHHDFSLVNRKLLNGDTYPHSPAYADGSFVSGMATPYDTSIISGNRMNPLAGTYMPYPMTNHHTTGNSSYSPNSRMSSRETEPQNPRSALLEEFRINAKTNKRYELRDIFNHVVEFSGDQHGSRFIQQKLETANSDEKDQIFTEIQTNCLQLMTDVFGNYVIQKLFEHGNQAQKKTLANHMKGHVLYLSTQMYGCRVVQKALEHVLTDQQASMVNELDGPNKQILKVIRDQNGNHVVQKAIERVPAPHIKFIIEAHKGEVVKLATHTYGCRVIQRILEHCEAEVKRIILDELHGCVAPLITDSFGNYVVQHIIEKGEAQDRRVVISIVQQNILHFSKHKFASNVVEKCIAHADSDQRKELVQGLTATNAQGITPVLGLLRDQYGNYVIQKVHGMLTGAELDALVHDMKVCLPQLKRTSYGKQVMAIEKLLYGANNGLSITTFPHSQQTMPGSTHNDHRTAQFGPHPSGFNNTTYNFSPLANYTSH